LVARTVVGLDLGTSGVRAVQVTGSKQNASLDRVAEIPLQRGVIEGGEVKDPQALSEALKELWEKGKFKTKEVVLGVSNAKVIVRQLDLPWMTQADLKQSIAFQVQDFIPMAVDEVNLDFHVLEEYGEGDGRMVRLLLVAASTEMINKVVQAVQGAGLRPIKADLTPFALIRAARPTAGAENSAEALVDVGSEVTNIVIHQGGRPRFVRILQAGGNGITGMIAERLGVPHETAEATKFEVASAPQQVDAGPADSVFGGGMPAQPAPAHDHPAQAIVNQMTAAFVGDVRTSLDYFLTSAPDVQGLSRVVLTGGGSRMPGLRERLSAELRIPVEFGTPVQGLSVNKSVAAEDVRQADQQMSVAVGLCLNEVN
jgi:type IV pilus assembly protein PilM